jgi:hypothetical protein
MASQIRSLLNQYVGLGFARQLAFADVLGERNWSVDLKQATVRFGNDLTFPMQLLGSQSDSSGNWLWAWANHQSNLPPAVTQLANTLKAWGEQHQVDEFSEGHVDGSVADGHQLSLVVSGMHGKCCCYRGPYDGGAIFFLVLNPPPEVIAPSNAMRAVNVITQVLSNFDVDSRPMAEAYLTAEGFQLQREPAATVAKRGREGINLVFDDLGRLTKANLSLN